ncbi:hypothetical protein G4402_14895 [Coprococcus comes]|uniref:hypothetical protein n=1 Tax=Coprococcus comes TaxID=410072 RepID=UPI001570F441|nr:hypothetical protein [Coprococcus comes]NSD15634.1 hypothetical protein [Coprococcus comes]
MAYDTTEAVAKFLSGFQMKITNRERDTVAPDYYVKYSLTLSKGGKGEDGYSLSGEAKDATASRNGLSRNQMGIEEKAAECKEAATVLANGNAL